MASDDPARVPFFAPPYCEWNSQKYAQGYGNDRFALIVSYGCVCVRRFDEEAAMSRQVNLRDAVAPYVPAEVVSWEVAERMGSVIVDTPGVRLSEHDRSRIQEAVRIALYQTDLDVIFLTGKSEHDRFHNL
jgi:hypothetical protein